MHIDHRQIDQLRYPIGKFQPKTQYYYETDTVGYIDEISRLPGQIQAAVGDMTEEQLDTPYRSGGWTIRQVIHHIVDSHINSYIRYRWALTEETPTIKAYDEGSWAFLPDAQHGPIDLSLDLITALHARWSYLLSHMRPDDFMRELVHPDWDSHLTLHLMTHLYAWHGKHHLAHITTLKEHQNW